MELKAHDAAYLYRASYGTTKYCSYWLRGMVDPNTECLFLHDVADEADSFSKDDMMAGYVAIVAGSVWRALPRSMYVIEQ